MHHRTEALLLHCITTTTSKNLLQYEPLEPLLSTSNKILHSNHIANNVTNKIVDNRNTKRK